MARLIDSNKIVCHKDSVRTFYPKVSVWRLDSEICSSRCISAKPIWMKPVKFAINIRTPQLEQRFTDVFYVEQWSQNHTYNDKPCFFVATSRRLYYMKHQSSHALNETLQFAYFFFKWLATDVQGGLRHYYHSLFCFFFALFLSRLLGYAMYYWTLVKAFPEIRHYLNRGYDLNRSRTSSVGL